MKGKAARCPTCGRLQETRTSEQNKKLNAMCNEVAKQLDWQGVKWSGDDWRANFAAALWGQKMMASVEGKGIVMLGRHTKDLPIDECSDLIELIYAFGANHGVVFKEPKQ
jgi:hypothetical protein